MRRAALNLAVDGSAAVVAVCLLPGLDVAGGLAELTVIAAIYALSVGAVRPFVWMVTLPTLIPAVAPVLVLISMLLLRATAGIAGWAGIQFVWGGPASLALGATTILGVRCGALLLGFSLRGIRARRAVARRVRQAERARTRMQHERDQWKARALEARSRRRSPA